MQHNLFHITQWLLVYFAGALYFVSSNPSGELDVYLKKAAGVYRNPTTVAPGQDLSKTVIITGANYGYMNHLHNFKCFIDRLELKVLVISMDARTHKYVSEKMPTLISFYWNDGSVVNEAATEFRSQQFHIITNRKKEAVLVALQLGYDALFVDTDVALLRDPMQYLLWQRVDYVHSLNHICPHSDSWDFFKTDEEGNTGFYYVRSNERTIKLFNEVMVAAPRFPGLDDQTIFWQLVRARKDGSIVPLKTCGNYNINVTSSQLVTCHLDGCVFSAGALRGVAYTWLRDNLKKKKERAVTIHANYMKGNEAKMRALNQHGYWLATKAKDGTWSGQCQSFTPQF